MKTGAGCLISILSLAAVLALVILLTGCAGFDAFKSGAAAHGAATADRTLEVARWGNCEAATVGAIKRRYSTDLEGLAVWQQFCNWPVVK